jgi:signal transduction histidine kinase
MSFADPCMRIRRLLHDLSQPLSVVTGLVDLILLEMDERNPYLREIQTISQQLEQVLEIVTQIRTLAREGTEAPGYASGLASAH